MMYKWERSKERLLRFMAIEPKKKLEWLRQMNEFTAKFSSKETKEIRRKLREKR